MRLRNVKNKEEILKNTTYLVLNPEENKSKWSKTFGNKNPIYIEIGMGKGDFIIENAIRYPNINFIGIEKEADFVEMSAKRLNEATLIQYTS